MQSLTNVLFTLFNHIDCSIPTVVMGDFNEDISTYCYTNVDASQTQLLRWMLENGFHQIVRTPTTDRGTLIDHVYYSGPFDILVEIQDTYYSDHDVVFLSIPLNRSH